MDKTEQRIIEIIDAHREEIIAFGRDIFSHGELGYKETRTADKFKTELEKLHIRTQDQLAITGVKGYLKEGKYDTSIALIGELDALRIPNHMCAWEETGGAHACGHHAQLTGVVGAALALADPEISAVLDGQVVFFGVPAEEYGEIDFKNKLRDEKRIKYGGGKCELIRIGAFDDIDVSVTHHTIPDDAILVGSGSNSGFVSKVIRYHGKAAHAAGSPDKGVNALNAASLGLQALGMHRETFRDEDHVRIHPIITKGGDLVNVVPDEVVIETLVRAGNIEAIQDASDKTDRAFRSGADALGCGYTIETMPGYLPVLPEEADEDLYEVAKIAAGNYPVRKIEKGYRTGGSTDVGDLQHIMPVLRFTTNGVKGVLHSVDFHVEDEELDYIVTAKIFALMAYRLLRNKAKKAKEIKQAYRPVFTKESYTQYMDSQIKLENRPLPVKAEEGYIPKKAAIDEVRKASRQFAMLYFHFAKVLYETYGMEKAKELIQKAVFELGMDRSGQVRKNAEKKGCTVFDVSAWQKNWDLAFMGWVKAYGDDYCPYAVEWRKYYEKYPWFKELAPFYCDIIDTTVIENFSKNLSHRITQNMSRGDKTCARIYYESEAVKNGDYTYGKADDTVYISEP